jgi:hypothetical protein
MAIRGRRGESDVPDHLCDCACDRVGIKDLVGHLGRVGHALHCSPRTATTTISARNITPNDRRLGWQARGAEGSRTANYFGTYHSLRFGRGRERYTTPENSSAGRWLGETMDLRLGFTRRRRKTLEALGLPAFSRNGITNGEQVGHIAGSVVYASTIYGMTGQQVGYVDSGRNFEGGSNGTYGGQDIGQAAQAHPVMNLACYLLLT